MSAHPHSGERSHGVCEQWCVYQGCLHSERPTSVKVDGCLYYREGERETGRERERERERERRRGGRGRVSVNTQELQRGDVSLRLREKRAGDLEGVYTCQVISGRHKEEGRVGVIIGTSCSSAVKSSVLSFMSQTKPAHTYTL